MNIIIPYANIILIHGHEADSDSPGLFALKDIERFGRISHRSEDKITDDSWSRFIRAVVLDHGDWSITEHASVTCDFLVDRGITHELVRHRLFAFTQESTRFVNYEKKMPPSFIDPYTAFTSVGSLGITQNSPCVERWRKSIEEAEAAYKEIVSQGVAPQIARSVFPNALASRIVITGNLRNWRHVLLLRTTKESHPQMRQVMIPLLQQFKTAIPLLYDDIEPNGRQIDNMRKPR